MIEKLQEEIVALQYRVSIFKEEERPWGYTGGKSLIHHAAFNFNIFTILGFHELTLF
jgi:hypothetical protein